ncbi:hypothetical protein [Glaciihabitans sp. dw_435]|uniref:hypothetical protein n=1 Tax=Glaciihabitans sp. dw_435 TaxID=2720081 RepID=UPI001BD6A538|nr:hypothetical protein [Glaciihabitans sp. dw_435]
MKTRIAAVAVLAAALALTATTAANADETYPSDISANTAAPGADITFSAPETGEAPGTPANISLTGDLAAEEATITAASTLTSTVAVAADGSLTFDVSLPTNAAPGSTYTLAVSADDGVGASFNQTQTLTVAAVPADTAADAADGTTDGLAETGTDSLPYFWFGGGLLVIGAGFITAMTIVRRNRSHGTQA